MKRRSGKQMFFILYLIRGEEEDMDKKALEQALSSEYLGIH